MALVSARPLGPLFLVLIVASALLVVPRSELGRVVRASRSAAFAVAAVTIACVGWTLSVGTLRTSTVEYPEFESLRRYLYTMVLSLDDFNRQMIGVLGWLDTPLLAHAYDIWFAMFGFLVIAALGVGERRHRVLLLGLVALTAIVPIAVQLPAAPELGIVWQGRYLLPLAVGIPLVAGWVLSASPGWNEAMRSRWAAGLPLVVLAVLQVTAFWWALHRNVIGIDEGWSRVRAAVGAAARMGRADPRLRRFRGGLDRGPGDAGRAAGREHRPGDRAEAAVSRCGSVGASGAREARRASSASCPPRASAPCT